MGSYSKGEYIYVRSKIIEIDPQDTTRYRVKTNLANFYVTESGDTLKSDPAEIYTAREAYALFIEIAKMNSVDCELCFGSGFSNVQDVLLADMDLDDIRRKVLEWELSNKVSRGDMVYYLPDSHREGDEPIICVVLGVTEGQEEGTLSDNTYVLYDDNLDTHYIAKRTEITTAHMRSTKVVNALNDLDTFAQEAREEIEE